MHDQDNPGYLWCDVLESAEKLVGVQSDTANHVADDVRSIGGLALAAGEVTLDRTSKVLLGNTKDDLALLAARLWKVEFEDGLEVVGDDTLGDEVNVLERLDMAPCTMSAIARSLSLRIRV